MTFTLSLYDAGTARYALMLRIDQLRQKLARPGPDPDLTCELAIHLRWAEHAYWRMGGRVGAYCPAVYRT